MSTQPQSFEQYWTIAEVAERLKVTPAAVKKWLIQKRLPRKKAGTRTLITETDLQNFIRKSTANADGDGPIG